MRLALLTITLCVTSFGAVFSDDFDASLGATTLNADIPNWTESNGTIDYLKHGYLGLDCRNATGGCLDMDGSSGNAGDITSIDINLLAGQSYRLTFWYSGNQRGGSNDAFSASFGGQTTNITGVTSNAPFTQGVLIVAPVADLTTQIVFSHVGGDNIGVILDDVVVEAIGQAAVPEPSSVLLMLSGAAGLAFLRRRR